ncbi:MAG: alternative ribosome rescue aminoacyl-tRNA hydrolase ArfB [Sphingobacteriaceae bacterium]
MDICKNSLLRSVVFKTSRSGGKGGQNVNKVSTKVELLFSFENNPLFDHLQIEKLQSRLSSRLNKDGLLQIFCEEERSQFLNKEKALGKLHQILAEALTVRKIRRATKPSRAVSAARSETKRMLSLKKERRRKDFDH